MGLMGLLSFLVFVLELAVLSIYLETVNTSHETELVLGSRACISAYFDAVVITTTIAQIMLMKAVMLLSHHHLLLDEIPHLLLWRRGQWMIPTWTNWKCGGKIRKILEGTLAGHHGNLPSSPFSYSGMSWIKFISFFGRR